MKSHWPFLLLLAAFIALACSYSIVTPLGEAPDEVSHWAYVQYLVTQHALPKPEGAVLGESHQPPLYYLLGGLATFWIPQPDFAVIANPDFAFFQAQTPNILLHTRREQFPYHGVPLAWHLVRLLSIAMGAVTVWATYKTCQVLQNLTGLRESSYLLPLAAAAFVAFLPGFTSLSAVVNNDNLVIMLSALGILQTLHVTRGDTRRRDLVILGAILGLAALTKLSGLVLWLFIAALLAWQAWNQRDWKALVRSGVWVFSIAIVIVVPWMVYNLAQYGDPLGWSLLMEATPVRQSPITWDDVVTLLSGLWTSFWGRFGGGIHLQMSDAVYVVLGAVPILALVGWLRRGRAKAEYTILGLFALFWFFMLAAFVRWTLVMLGTDQARQLYPGLPLLAIVVMLGLACLFTERARLALALASGGLFALDVAVLVYLGLTFAPPPLDANVLPRLGGASANFGDTIRVVDYRVEPIRVTPGNSVTVWINWQALRDSGEDYWLLLQLAGTGEPVANKDGVPAAGRPTTDWWQKGQAFTSYHTLTIPDDLAPGTYTLRLGLHRFGRWEWLLVNGGDMLPLGKIEVVANH